MGRHATTEQVDEVATKSIENILTTIRKRFGTESINRIGDGLISSVKAIPTGSLGLDIALGIGGVPRGRIVELIGAESSGKTTLALHMIAEAQKLGDLAAFVDAENSIDLNYAKRLGVEVDNLLLSQPDSAEEALEIVEMLVEGGAKIVVIDSVAALVPKAELEGDMGQSHMGLAARLMSQACRKLTSIIAKNDCCVVFINQIRMKIGVLFGNPETTPGGNALKFYASVRLDVRKIGDLKLGEVKVGSRTRVKVIKNKVGPPTKEAEYDILWGKGISKNGELVDIGVENDIVTRSGAWFSYKENNIGQGRENSINYLKEHLDIAKEIEHKIHSLNNIN